MRIVPSSLCGSLAAKKRYLLIMIFHSIIFHIHSFLDKDPFHRNNIISTRPQKRSLVAATCWGPLMERQERGRTFPDRDHRQ